MLVQMNGIEFNSRYLGSLHLHYTDRPASYTAAGHGLRDFCRLQLEHKASALALDLTHCSRDKHLARPHTHTQNTHRRRLYSFYAWSVY